MGFWSKVKERLTKTRTTFVDRVLKVFTGRSRMDDEVYEELEQILIEADVGVDTTMTLLNDLRNKAREEGVTDPQAFLELLKAELVGLMTMSGAELIVSSEKPCVTLVVGVNGSGKTTTIGKLASLYVSQGKKVLLGAADTFRAAAADQLAIWSDRANVEIVRHQEGSDPAAVCYDAIEAAVARGVDHVIVDTAGRLHTKVNLMEELKKIQRVIRRKIETAPHEVLLVLDSTTGQNGLQQAKVFTQALTVTGIVLTKLDGTAKGGIVIAIQKQLGIPIKMVGVGESIDDLHPFNAAEFVDALFG